MDNRNWYKLDNAGKLYPSITSTRRSTVFRLSAKTTTDVKPAILQKALEVTVNRFPYYKVNLKRGLFWYYFEESDHMPEVKEESHYPCMFLRYRRKKTFPFRVLYYNSYIHLEISHSIADGHGALIFLKTLMVEYYRQLEGLAYVDLKGAKNIDEKPLEGEYEDAFAKYYQPGVPQQGRPDSAVNFPFTLMEKGKYSFLTGIVAVAEVKKVAGTFGCTVTQYIAGIYFMAIQDYKESAKGREQRAMTGRVVLNLPVDLRRIFPSETMKNFFVSLTPMIDLRLGHYELEEVINYLKSYMKIHMNKKNFSKYISRNVKNERNPIIRIVPLGLKNIVMPWIYVWFGERGYTSSISNMGRVELPGELEPYVEAVEFFPPPSEMNKIKMCISTYKGNMYLSFGRTTDNTEIEKFFFRRLVKSGISVKVETNMSQTGKGGR